MNTHATISVMLVWQIVYVEALFDFEGNILHRKILVMDSLYACNFFKSDSNTGVFQ